MWPCIGIVVLEDRNFLCADTKPCEDAPQGVAYLGAIPILSSPGRVAQLRFLPWYSGSVGRTSEACTILYIALCTDWALDLKFPHPCLRHLANLTSSLTRGAQCHPSLRTQTGHAQVGTRPEAYQNLRLIDREARQAEEVAQTRRHVG